MESTQFLVRLGAHSGIGVRVLVASPVHRPEGRAPTKQRRTVGLSGRCAMVR